MKYAVGKGVNGNVETLHVTRVSNTSMSYLNKEARE